MNKKGLLTSILFITFILGIVSFVVVSIVDVYDDIITDCHEYKKVKYRYEGTGGLFGGTEKIIVHKDSTNFDGYEKMCMEGTNWWGKKIKR